MRLIPERPVSSCGEAKRATNPQMGVVGSRGRGAHTIVRCKVGTVHGSLYLANGCSNGERHWGDLLVSAVGPTIQDGTELHHNTVQNRGLSVRGSTMQALGRCRRDAIPPAEGQFFHPGWLTVFGPAAKGWVLLLLQSIRYENTCMPSISNTSGGPTG